MNSNREFTHEMAQRVTERVTRGLTKAVVFVILITIVILICGEIVYRLWNWLMPSLFHLAALTTLWQAFGLMALSWILFGGLRGYRGSWRGRRDRWQHRMRERWEQMTPEERDKFRAWIESRAGQA